MIPAEDDQQDVVEEQEMDGDRLNVGLGVPTKLTLPPIPTIRFGACFL